MLLALAATVVDEVAGKVAFMDAFADLGLLGDNDLEGVNNGVGTSGFLSTRCEVVWG